MDHSAQSGTLRPPLLFALLIGAGCGTPAPQPAPPPDHGDCDRYIECVAAAMPTTAAAAVASFGSSSPCWKGTEAEAKVCRDACTASLAQVRKAYPAVAACGACRSDADCHAPTPACHGRKYVCVACQKNADCTDPMKPTCDVAAGVCLGCINDDDCGDASQVCYRNSCCTPDCGDATCDQMDGCGRSCGQCGYNSVCLDHHCCRRMCDGKECGSDGCQGSCGGCDIGLSCQNGLCTFPMGCAGNNVCNQARVHCCPDAPYCIKDFGFGPELWCSDHCGQRYDECVSNADCCQGLQCVKPPMGSFHWCN